MKPPVKLAVGIAAVLMLVTIRGGLGLLAARSQQPGAMSAMSTSGVPQFEVDPMWPKPLPNHWVVGAVIGVAVDSRDHVWIVHRPSSLAAGETLAGANPPKSTCCIAAPPVIEFDADGNVVQAWGGPGQGYEWPTSEHGIWIDYKNNVWLGGNSDDQVLKFTSAGKFLLQIGHRGKSKGNTDTENLNKPADIDVDPTTNEVYVADGYGNRRVIVFDADTGKYKRMWGAYGKKPDDVIPAGEFDPSAPLPQRFGSSVNGVHCVRVSKDGFVYVCDRQNHRIQVFHRDGSYVKEVFIAAKAGEGRSAWDVDFSPDPAQTFLYEPDAENDKVWVLGRESLEILGSFGRGGGHWAGGFYGAHSIGIDSKGNAYIGETYEGKRVQKFAYTGNR